MGRGMGTVPLGAPKTQPGRPSWMSSPVATWQRSPGWVASPREGAGHILMACLQLLGTSSQLPALFLPGGGCGEAGEGAATMMGVKKEPPKRWSSGFPSSHVESTMWSCCRRSWAGWR